MPPKPKDIDVDVVITQGPGGPTDLQFELSPGGDRIEVKNDNHPGAIVCFNIDDRAGSGLSFQPNPANALWVAPPIGPAAPPPPCPNGPSIWAGFLPLSVEQNNAGKNTRLITYYRNERKEKCRFALRFLWPDGTPKDYDPIGDGANGLRK